MFTFDEEFIRRSFETFHFNVDEDKIKLIEYVPMLEYRVSSKNKPLLLVEGLQICIGLYAWSPTFCFASHINTLDSSKNYIKDYQGNPIWCHMIDYLYHEIASNNNNRNHLIKIGISLGCNPYEKDYITRALIEKGLYELVLKLNGRGLRHPSH
jgi:hypothetical protein